MKPKTGFLKRPMKLIKEKISQTNQRKKEITRISKVRNERKKRSHGH